MKFFNLAFVSAFYGKNLQNRNSQVFSHLDAAKLPHGVHLDVGGIKYSLNAEDVRKHPGSFFETILNDYKQCGNEILVNRDGKLFKFVNAFLVNGQLPRDALSPEILTCLSSEADFFGLEALHNECNSVTGRVVNLLDCSRTKSVITPFKNVPVKYPVPIHETQSTLFYDLRRILAPLCIAGDIFWYNCGSRDPIVQSSTVRNPNTVELITLATHVGNDHSPSCNTFVLDDTMLNTKRLDELSNSINLARMFPHNGVKCVPSKLVIQTAGSEYHPTMKPDVERNSTYLGTLVAVLNSTFSGGGVTVGTGPEAATFDASAMQWFAVHAEGTYALAPVTAGTRVSVEYDMYECNAPVDCRTNRARYLPDDYLMHDREGKFEANVAALVGTQCTPTAVRDRTIFTIDEELKEQDAVLIGLQHLYPDFDRDGPSALRGGDRALYELLSEQYEVQMAAATVHRYRKFERPYVGFNSVRQPRPASAELYFPPDASEDLLQTASCRSKLFLPLPLTDTHVLDTDEVDYDYDPDVLFIVSALRVKKK